MDVAGVTTRSPWKSPVLACPVVLAVLPRLEHRELPAKLLDYFLRSNKSNISQILPFLHSSCTELKNVRVQVLLISVWPQDPPECPRLLQSRTLFESRVLLKPDGFFLFFPRLGWRILNLNTGLIHGW